MNETLIARRNARAQTLVFFVLAFGTILLLAGLAIDSGALFLAKARLSRAVDGAALAAVGNFHRYDDETANRNAVAVIMRNFATANFTDLATISSDPNAAALATKTYPLPTGGTGVTYTYNFNDGVTDPNGAYKRFVQVAVNTGSGGSITSASCSARCPSHVYFIHFMNPNFRDLKVSSSAQATRNPRLIMVVVDRSASMLAPGGGAYGLPQAIVQFLDFFDTSSDNIGIVSFGSNARLEMPLTTNFIVAGTNLLFDAYQNDNTETDISGNSPVGIPGVDPEQSYDPNYASTGVRRLKFGGQTAADDGIRLGMEQLMANNGFNDPDVVKYMVIFTDGKWNAVRTLAAAPGYTNVVYGPAAAGPTSRAFTNVNVWSTNMALNTNLVPVPTLSPMPYVTNAIGQDAVPYYWDFVDLKDNHLNDFWQNTDPNYEPIGSPSNTANPSPNFITNGTYLGTKSPNLATNYYGANIDVWLQPGAVDYFYSTNSSHVMVLKNVYVSNFNNPAQHINIQFIPGAGESNVLVVPGYVADGLLFDGIDLAFARDEDSDYPRFRGDNYHEAYMWPDNGTPVPSDPLTVTTSTSMERNLMFRNYANLLTGYTIYRPDDPLGTGIEHYITDGTDSDSTGRGAYRPVNGLGPWYPGAAFYWPFDDVGVDWDPTFALTNALVHLDTSGHGVDRKASYSINMLSPVAAPRWAGEWFYKGTGGTTSVSGASSVSTLMANKSDWLNGAPGWVSANFDNSVTAIYETNHNSNIIPTARVWRPLTFNGSGDPVTFAQIQNRSADAGNNTGGYVTDGVGNYFRNAMAYSGRPTHYYDFSRGTWVQITNNHIKNTTLLPLGNWKAQEYAWHARAQGVKIYTVGYGSLVSQAQQVLLAQIANSTNTTAGNPQYTDASGNLNYTPGPGTGITYYPNQPIGQQYFATNDVDISNDFYQVGQAINVSITK